MMKKNLLVIALSLAVTGGIFLSGANKAQATFDWNICDFIDCNPSIIVPSIEPTVSVDPTEEPTPTPCMIWVGEFEQPCPTPTVTIDPSDTPTATPEATVAPTSPPSSHGDGLSDGRSSCPDCTKAPSVPSAPPKTGRG